MSSSSDLTGWAPLDTGARVSQASASATRVLGADASEHAGLAPMSTPELRHGEWTRHGSASVLGDRVTETLLGGLAEQTRAAATAQGYAVGWAQAQREARSRGEEAEAQRREAAAAAERRREGEHRAAVDALAAAAVQVRATLGELSARIEQQGTDLAWAVVEELLDHQLLVEGGSAVIQRVLDVLPPGPLATVRLHPGVVATAAARDLEQRGILVRADATLAPADALVEYDAGVVDLRLDRARARIREALGIEQPGTVHP